MAPRVVDRELKALADQDVPGALTERGEFVMDRTMKDAVAALAAEMGGRGAGGKALRMLVQKGAVQVLAERAERA